MNYLIILAFSFGLVCTGVLGYFLGRYQTKLVDRIRTLESQKKEVPPEPVKPVVAGGAYQPPKEITNAVDNKPGAGIVETKTPQQLDWESSNEMAKLEHSN